jgi:hypothetical protein
MLLIEGRAMTKMIGMTTIAMSSSFIVNALRYRREGRMIALKNRTNPNPVSNSPYFSKGLE